MSVPARRNPPRDAVVSNPGRAPSNSDVYPAVPVEDALFSEPSGEKLVDQRRDASVLFDVEEHERQTKLRRCRQFAAHAPAGSTTKHSCMVDLRRLTPNAQPTTQPPRLQTGPCEALSAFDSAPSQTPTRLISALALVLGMALAFALGVAAWSLF